jgi:hypothetical protein
VTPSVAPSSPHQRLQPEQTRFNCPNCGGLLPHRFRYSKIVVCSYCNSILYLQGAEATILGQQAALAHYPSLLVLGRRYRYRNLAFEPVGMARFSYPAGYWEEWWVITQAQEGRWISVDEGDFAIEEPVVPDTELPAPERLGIGAQVRLFQRNWTVTERDSGRLLGIRGELPEAMDPRRSFEYIHLSAPGSHLVTIELAPPAPPRVFRGTWMDPFEIRTLTTPPPLPQNGAPP